MPDIVCSAEEKYDVRVSHRSALEPDNKRVLGGITGGIIQNHTDTKLLTSNAYAEKYGPLLAPPNPLQVE